MCVWRGVCAFLFDDEQHARRESPPFLVPPNTQHTRAHALDALRLPANNTQQRRTHTHTHTPRKKKQDLDLLLRTAGVRNLVLVGITTDVCVSTTMREANDRGYEVLLLLLLLPPRVFGGGGARHTHTHTHAHNPFHKKTPPSPPRPPPPPQQTLTPPPCSRCCCCATRAPRPTRPTTTRR